MLAEAEAAQRKIWIKYQELLDNLRLIQRSLKSFPNLGWDLSLAELSSQDIQEVLRWGKFFEDNQSVRELCELLGKMRKAAKEKERVKIEETIAYKQIRKDYNSREELSGITFGNRIEDVLPQELALLGDEELAVLFDLKFIENRLLCFEKMGYVSNWETKKEEKEVEVEKKEKIGPIIICVDTSGSMMGTPENIAKAVSLCLAEMAHTQNRDCYLINFSTTIETFDFKPPKGFRDLIAFLKNSFHGGTDVAPALNEALKMMECSSYRLADLLVVSDFCFPENDEVLESRIRTQRKSDNRFYSLVISNGYPCDSLMGKSKYFDEIWHFDTASQNIRHLHSHISKISDQRP